jgi:hypothetical protein
MGKVAFPYQSSGKFQTAPQWQYRSIDLTYPSSTTDDIAMTHRGPARRNGPP